MRNCYKYVECLLFLISLKRSVVFVKNSQGKVKTISVNAKDVITKFGQKNVYC